MNWLVRLKRAFGESTTTLNWEVYNEPDEKHAKKKAEAEAEEEGIMDFCAESAEAII